MPKETIWGSVVTVRDGDLPVMAARTRADLAALDLVEPPTAEPTDVDLVRRRYQLLAQLVELTARDASAGVIGVEPLDVVRNFRERHAELTTQLDRLRVVAAHVEDLATADAATDGRDARSEPERRVQQTVTVAWGRDEGEVRLFTAAHDHDAGEPVDLGGHWVALNWGAVNRLIRKLKVARDQAFGTPE